jgi:acetylornithine aminotransferase
MDASAAVATTDNKNCCAYQCAKIVTLPLNDVDLVEAELKGDVACVIIEPIQGVGGLDQGTTEFKHRKKYKAKCCFDFG